jgi:hypothetical protein
MQGVTLLKKKSRKNFSHYLPHRKYIFSSMGKSPNAYYCTSYIYFQSQGIEAEPRVLKAHHGVVEIHPGAIKAYHELADV